MSICVHLVNLMTERRTKRIAYQLLKINAVCSLIKLKTSIFAKSSLSENKSVITRLFVVIYRCFPRNDIMIL